MIICIEIANRARNSNFGSFSPKKLPKDQTILPELTSQMIANKAVRRTYLK